MLRSKSAFILTFAAALAACTANPSPQEDVGIQPVGAITTEATVVVPTELAMVRPAFISTWSTTDPAGFTTYFGDNVVVVTPTERITGWNDVRRRWLAPQLTGMSNYTVVPISFTREGDFIIENGRYMYRVTHTGGHTMDKTVNYSYRWQKQPDGNWKITEVTIK